MDKSKHKYSYCIVKNCLNHNSSTQCNVSFHRFPFKNPEILNKWFDAGEYKRSPCKSSVVCSEHFHDSSYIHCSRVLGFKRQKLKKDAVPSNFSCQQEQMSKEKYHIIEKDTTTGSNKIYKRQAEKQSEMEIDTKQSKTVKDSTPSISLNLHSSQISKEKNPFDVNRMRPNQTYDEGPTFTILKDIEQSKTDMDSTPSKSAFIHYSSIPQEKEIFHANPTRPNQSYQGGPEPTFLMNIDIETSQTVKDTAPSSSENTNSSQKPDNFHTTRKTKSKSTQTVKKSCHLCNNKVKNLKKKVQNLKKKIVRKENKIKNLSELISEIKKKCNINQDLEDILRTHFEGFSQDFILNLYKSTNSPKNCKRYSDVLKQFSLTLYYYSPKAYKFVRKIFALPHPSRLKCWTTNVNCAPGFLEEVFSYLKKIQNQPDTFSIQVKECALVLDGMSIREQLVWDNEKKTFTGYVNLGGIIHSDSEALAKEAIFFQIVSLSSNFKSPIAYFLINGIQANVLSNLIKTSIIKLQEVGVTVRSVTCDGTTTNLQALNLLNCSTSPDNLKSNFKHPTLNVDVYAYLDPCHMLKLARNVLAEKGTIESPEGSIRWCYIENLNKLQNSEDFKFANALGNKHIFFQNKKMNVALAAQTLSSSVANAIEFLERSKHPDFQGSAPTVSFIRRIDKLFDILNSRSIFSKGYKHPIKIVNMNMISEFLEDMKMYLESLKIEKSKATHHPRRTFAIGFLICIDTLKKLAPELLFREIDPLKYFLTYKLSQDHIEILFSQIRSKGGWNNNPNSGQLKTALKALLLKANVSIVPNANICDFQISSTPIIEFRNHKRKLEDQEENKEDELMNKETSNLFSSLESVELSNYKRNILYYISGFVVRRIFKNLNCEDCLVLLSQNSKSKYNDHSYSTNSLDDYTAFQFKISAGGLVNASDSVFKIVEYTEKLFVSLISSCEKITNFKIEALIIGACKHFSTECPMFVSHPIVSAIDIEDLHETKLIKQIVTYYLKVRCKAYGNRITNQSQGKRFGLRQKLTKIVTFSHI